MQPEQLALLAPVLLPFVALLGACMGSFLNVCIYRIPLELSVVRPRSFCPNCRRPIPWYLNIPVLSWLCLGGRCRYCRAPISARYLLVEVLTAALFLAVALRFADRPLLIPVYWLVVFGLLLGTFVDIEHLIIPDRVSIGGMLLGLALSPFVPLLHDTTDHWQALLRSGIGCAVGFGTLWLVATVGRWAFRREAMGFGDVKLMGAIGAFFGWQAVLFSVIGSSFFGSFVGIGLILCGKRQLQSRIPYGPFIAAAALVWMFTGPTLVRMYLRMLQPA
ncbi:MAG: prepilin peptidase [Kiritimatiellae bacterium]|nr:prepilin peptidase [Kiritimatiellia bacterium]